jgi:asparagine synthase (glutamine-hydrolysing)
MAWGAEARVPYLDHRIVEFGLGLPDTLKMHRRMGKVLLRREWYQVDGVKGLTEAQQRTGGHREQVWGLMQFAIWHRIFVAQQGRQPERNADPLDWIR